MKGVGGRALRGARSVSMGLPAGSVALKSLPPSPPQGAPWRSRTPSGPAGGSFDLAASPPSVPRRCRRRGPKQIPVRGKLPPGAVRPRAATAEGRGGCGATVSLPDGAATGSGTSSGLSERQESLEPRQRCACSQVGLRGGVAKSQSCQGGGTRHTEDPASSSLSAFRTVRTRRPHKPQSQDSG